MDVYTVYYIYQVIQWESCWNQHANQLIELHGAGYSARLPIWLQRVHCSSWKSHASQSLEQTNAARLHLSSWSSHAALGWTKSNSFHQSYVFTLVLSDRALWSWGCSNPSHIIIILPRYPNSKACWLPKPAKPPARPQRRKSHRSLVVALAASEAAGPRGRKSDWHSQVGLPHAGDKKN